MIRRDSAPFHAEGFHNGVGGQVLLERRSYCSRQLLALIAGLLHTGAQCKVAKCEQWHYNQDKKRELHVQGKQGDSPSHRTEYGKWPAVEDGNHSPLHGSQVSGKPGHNVAYLGLAVEVVGKALQVAEHTLLKVYQNAHVDPAADPSPADAQDRVEQI